jgi:hypothetical protein
MLVIAATLGGVAGSLLTWQFATAASKASRLAAREFLVLSEDGKTAAKLTSAGGRSVLAFLDEKGKIQVEIGVDRASDSRFVTFTGRSGLSTMSLRSEYPHSEASLALGDDFLQGKAVLGAQPSDLHSPPTDPPGPDLSDWGLLLNRFGQISPAISILVQPKGPNSKTGLWVEQPTGPAWTAPPNRR